MRTYFSEKFRNFLNNINKPGLIKQLEKDHKILFKIYDNITIDFYKDRYDDVLKNLNIFFYKYKKHVLLEDNYLYMKLLKKYKDYPNIISFIQDMKSESNEITENLERFMLIYNNIDILKSKKKEFSHDLEKLGLMLSDRIDFEENRLYILY